MDIDIDVPVSFDPRKVFGDAVIPASRVTDSLELVKHPCGVYFQNIAVDPLTQLSAIPFKVAEQCGYTKYDFLHLSILDQFADRSELIALLTQPINWKLLEDPLIVAQLFQLRNSWDVLSKVKPTSIQELADVVAMIRPGKRVLLRAYLQQPSEVREQLYRASENEDKSSFRRGHAIAYAYVIALQLIKLQEQVLT